MVICMANRVGTILQVKLRIRKKTHVITHYFRNTDGQKRKKGIVVSFIKVFILALIKEKMLIMKMNGLTLG